MKNKILVVDDDYAVITSLHILLTEAGFEVEGLSNPSLIESRVGSRKYDLVLLDMNFTLETSGKKGLAALKLIKRLKPEIPVILMTGWATVQLAVEGMKLGAVDFFAKPWENRELLHAVKSNLNEESERWDGSEESFEQIIGEDEGIREVIDTAYAVARTKASVLILGESGTGKELIAEAIHLQSNRRNKPFVKVNLGGMSESLFESEMFGHKKGAFTDAHSDRIGRFELADTGTIFLDEIGDLNLNMQVKLLRVLQESTFEPLGSSITKKVDVRVISATNKDLEKMVQDGKFREDLFYRLNLVTINIPPLRDRKGDVTILANHFLKLYAENYEKSNLNIDKEGLQWLEQQTFSGNIRQLRNLIEKVTLFSKGKSIRIEDLEKHYVDVQQNRNKALPEVGMMSLEEIEKEMIMKALKKYDQKVALAAKALGLTRSALYRRIEKYNIQV